MTTNNDELDKQINEAVDRATDNPNKRGVAKTLISKLRKKEPESSASQPED